MGLPRTGIALVFVDNSQAKSIAKEERERIIKKLLASSAELAEKGMTVRANIFTTRQDEAKAVHYIIHHWNMDSYDDKNLEVPLNMGCTGAAWQSKQQKFVLRKDFQQEAKHYLPESEWKKVWKDITWICSTPVFKNHQIIAVLNIDGDKNPGVEVQERIKRKGQSLADLLGDLV